MEQSPAPPRTPLQAEPAEPLTLYGAVMTVLCLLPAPLIILVPWIGALVGGGAIVANFCIYKQLNVAPFLRFMLVLCVNCVVAVVGFVLMAVLLFMGPAD